MAKNALDAYFINSAPFLEVEKNFDSSPGAHGMAVDQDNDLVYFSSVADGMITVDSKTKFFIDKKSIKKINNYIYYWSLANYLILEEDDNPDIKSFISYHRLDCNDMGYQIILMSFYGKYMGRGENLTHFIDPDTEEEKRFHQQKLYFYEE